ncbi:MAG: hypothetical protein M3083_05910 [Actinomycetota bacterium]|nr:hypothetical protein [Actinomycetota bacterium]
MAVLALAAALVGLAAAPVSARAATVSTTLAAKPSPSAPGAKLTYPADGQTNVDTTRPFTWSTIPASQGTILVIGIAKFGSHVANSGVLPAAQTSYAVPALPTGKTLYATLFTEVGGGWTRYDAISFTVGLPSDRFRYPVDGQTNVDATRAFTWSTVAGSQGEILVIGTAKFGTDLVFSGVLPAGQSSYLPRALPTGKTLYATLFTEVGGAWTRYDAISFTVGLPADRFRYPMGGQTNVDSARAFTWSTVAGSQSEILVVGTAKFGTDLVFSGILAPSRTSFTTTALPAGKTLYATLFTEVGGAWTRYDAISFTTAAALAHGSLDRSFGTDGQVVVDAANSTPISLGYVASTGQSLVGVLASDGANGVISFIERLTSSGAIDSTFGNGGIVNLPTKMQVRQVLGDGAGDIVAAGIPPSGAQSGVGTELVRLTATGSLDAGFGTGGIVTIAAGTFSSLVLGPDGRIFVSLVTATGPSTSELAIAAFTSSGAIDPTFGNAGRAMTTLAGQAGGGGIAIQPDGNLVIDGSVSTAGNPTNAVVARFLATGQPDTHFADNGVFVHLFGANANGDALRTIIVTPSGDLVVAGIQFSPHDGTGLMAEITPSGVLNPSFGTGGVILENPTLNDWDIFQALAVNANNEIYGLLMQGTGPFNGSLRRYTANGRPDPVFGTAGVVDLPNVIPIDMTLAHQGRPEVALEIPPTSASVVAERFVP